MAGGNRRLVETCENPRISDKMAALIRGAVCIVVPLLILQLQGVGCNDEGEEDEAAEPKRTEPLSWDELKYTRLQEINTVARKVQDILENSEDANALATADSKTKPLRTAAQESVVNGDLSNVSSGGLKAKTEEVNKLLCSVAQRFRSHLKSIVYLAELVVETERPQFQEITNNEPTDDDEKFKQAVQSLTASQKESQVQSGTDAVAQKVSPKESESTVARSQGSDEVKKTLDGANYVLNTIYDAMIANKNVQRELKHAQDYPQDVAEEEARIKKALALYKALDCSSEKAARRTWKAEDPAASSKPSEPSALSA